MLRGGSFVAKKSTRPLAHHDNERRWIPPTAAASSTRYFCVANYSQLPGQLGLATTGCVGC